MGLTDFQRRVAEEMHLDLAAFFDAFRTQGGSDVDGFLAYLSASRGIDPAVLRELHGLADVETPSLVDPAYQGTLLARWSALSTLPASAAGPPSMREAAARAAAMPVSDVRFQPLSRIGQGAMGAVDIARDVYLRRKIALKTVRPQMAGQPTVFSRFLSEMQITAQLEHPNIVPVYALDVSQDGSLGYAMKLVQGKDLAQILAEARAKIEKGEPLGAEHGLDKRLEHFIKVCDAVEFAHSKNILHRDLKPANVMIGRHNEVYLMDWGIARPIGPRGASHDQARAPADPTSVTGGVEEAGRTRLGDAVGTPSYMSPEQVMGDNDVLDARSDQYALGLILHECVALRTAVTGATVQAILSKQMLGIRDPLPLGARLAVMPREIDAIVRRATQLDPKKRYPSVAALADDVRRYMRGQPVLALHEGPIRKAARFLGRHRMATLSLVLALVIVGGASTIGALVSGQRRIAVEHVRELRVSQMAAESAIQAQVVDRNLTSYETALAEFAGEAEMTLSRLPASDGTPYFDEAFRAKETAPPDFGPSARYRRDVSALAPRTSLAPNVARDRIAPLLGSLTSLGSAFRALLLSSSDADWRGMPPSAQRTLIADTGVPARRATLRLRDGITLTFPGMVGPTPPDPRDASSLEGAKGKRVVWGAPEVVDGESILPARAAIYDEHGVLRGVALLEVSVSLLLNPATSGELDTVESRSLVRRDGSVMAADGSADDRPPLPAEVSQAIAEGKSGTMVAEVNGRKSQYAFHPLSSLDWYYVAVSDLGRLVDSKGTSASRGLRQAGVAARGAATTRSISPSTPSPATPPSLSSLPSSVASGASGAPDASSGSDARAPALDTGSPSARPRPSRGGGPVGSALPPNPFDNWKYYDRKKKP